MYWNTSEACVPRYWRHSKTFLLTKTVTGPLTQFVRARIPSHLVLRPNSAPKAKTLDFSRILLTDLSGMGLDESPARNRALRLIDETKPVARRSKQNQLIS